MSEIENRTMDDAGEYIRSQEPLNNVYESSDFNQGLLRGRRLETMRILSWINQSIDSHKEMQELAKQQDRLDLVDHHQKYIEVLSNTVKLMPKES